MPSTILTELDFSNGAKLWLDSRRPYLSARVFHEYGAYIQKIYTFLGDIRLDQITADHIRAYQRHRMERAGASIINHECSILQQLLKRVGRWAAIAPDFQSLPLPRESPGRCIEEAEEKEFFQVALSNPAYHVIAWMSAISVNTTAHSKEIRYLRMKDVDLEQRTITVNALGAKNRYRQRVLPLNAAAFWAVEESSKRAKELGAFELEHFLFPFKVHRSEYDPRRPAADISRVSFRAIKITAGLQFRFEDWRHTAITRMLERGVPEETVIAMAGHVSRQMLRYYAHIRMESKRAAVAALEKIPPTGVHLPTSLKVGCS